MFMENPIPTTMCISFFFILTRKNLNILTMEAIQAAGVDQRKRMFPMVTVVLFCFPSSIPKMMIPMSRRSAANPKIWKNEILLSLQHPLALINNLWAADPLGDDVL